MKEQQNKTTEKRVSMWGGRPIIELSREELLDVIEFLGKDMLRMKEEHKKKINVLAGWEQ